jgi:hypothetical protein
LIATEAERLWGSDGIEIPENISNCFFLRETVSKKSHKYWPAVERGWQTYKKNGIC